MRRVIAVVVLTAAAVGITGCTAPTPAPAQTTVLPFTGLTNPHDVAVDSTGTVYVTDAQHVLELKAGSTTPNVVPQFDDAGLMVDASGAVWVEDAAHSHLVKLAPGSDERTTLPLPDLGVRGAIHAVDEAGNVYGSNGGGVDPSGACCMAVHMVKSSTGSATPTALPFKGVDGLSGMVVNAAGDLYVGDYEHRQVLKLAAGSDAPMPVLTNVDDLVDIAVDTSGNVYAVDAQHHQVVKAPAGQDNPTVLPFAGLDKPIRVTVDAAGGVYVLDGGTRQVFKLTQA
jgi:streptogramin lyase